jgi:hypothetical protein
MDPAEETNLAVLVLVRTSLALWGADASVNVEAGKLGILLSTGLIEIRRAPAELPFRWLVSHAGRDRAASSVTGLLRVLRSALDPAYRPGRARIAALPLPPAAP